MKKWKASCAEYPGAEEALASLTPQSNSEAVERWRGMAERAAAERRNNVEVMDIYDVQASKSTSSECCMSCFPD